MELWAQSFVQFTCDPVVSKLKRFDAQFDTIELRDWTQLSIKTHW